MRTLTLLALVLWLPAVTLAGPLGTEFTYQGYLEDDNGFAANDDYDFEFRLYDAETAGNLVGSFPLSAVSVKDGIFSVELDFGTSAFQGSERWLEIQVANQGEPLQPLTPRQKLSATPYALYALNAPSLGGSGLWQQSGVDISNTNSGNVGIGTTTPGAKLGVAGGARFDNKVDAVQGVTVHDTPGATSPRASLWDADFFGSPLGGQLHTWDEAGALTGIFGSSFGDGGMFSLLSKDGSQGVVGNGGITHGDFGIWNDGSERTAYLTGDEGDLGADLALHNGRTQTVELDANQNQGGYLGLRRGDGVETVQLRANYEDGDSYFRLRNGLGTRAEIGTQGGGTMVLRNQVAIGTIAMDAENNFNAGQIEVKQEFGVVGVGIYGNWGDGKGRIITDVLQITGGADLSESFDIGVGAQHDSIEPGMVVSIDPVHAGKLVVCGRAYDRRVAGIVSGAGGVEPGMVMGQKGSIASGEHPVALTGRVYCMADASNGPIEPGDLLTTSNLPGHAMRVDDPARAQGAILGKAMTSLESGRGMVLVLVGLQ